MFYNRLAVTDAAAHEGRQLLARRRDGAAVPLGLARATGQLGLANLVQHCRLVLFEAEPQPVDIASDHVGWTETEPEHDRVDGQRRQWPDPRLPSSLFLRGVHVA